MAARRHLVGYEMQEEPRGDEDAGPGQLVEPVVPLLYRILLVLIGILTYHIASEIFLQNNNTFHEKMMNLYIRALDDKAQAFTRQAVEIAHLTSRNGNLLDRVEALEKQVASSKAGTSDLKHMIENSLDKLEAILEHGANIECKPSTPPSRRKIEKERKGFFKDLRIEF